MRAPSPSELMQRWERAQARPPVERPAALLTALDGDVAKAEWEQMPLGRRDAQVLALRERTFGSQLDCLADCPRCRAQVEFSVQANELQLPVPDETVSLSLTHDDLAISFRLPNSADLVAIAAEHDAATARRRIFARCLLSATGADGVAISAADVPNDLVRVVAGRMAEADPQANLTFALRCPQCEDGWEAPFDVAAFFWQELHAWARRMLQEVHELASAYGWSEAEVLALSPARRHAYLELIRT